MKALSAPAERADLVIDFRRFHGQHIKFVDTAGAPFHGAQSILVPDVPDLDNKLPCPDVMQFRVGHQVQPACSPLPVPLSPSFVRYSHAMPHSAHRYVALVENSDTHMLTLRELVEIANTQPGQPIVEIQEGANPVKQFYVAAHNFEDTVNFIVDYGATEIWEFISLTEDTHPMHVHLVQFQPLSRYGVINPDVFDLSTDSTSQPMQIDGNTIPLDANEQGWKDTIRINPKEMLAIMATFEGFAGRYMYHCHIIEHEDSEMMRPFVVQPMRMADQMGNMWGQGICIPDAHTRRFLGNGALK